MVSETSLHIYTQINVSITYNSRGLLLLTGAGRYHLVLLLNYFAIRSRLELRLVPMMEFVRMVSHVSTSF